MPPSNTTSAQLAQQPLLETPPKKKPNHPFIFLTLFLSMNVLMVIAIHLIKTPPSYAPITYCDLAHDPLFCTAMVTELISSNTAHGRSTIPSDLLKLILAKQTTKVHNTIYATKVYNQFASNGSSVVEKASIQDCLQLLEHSLERIMDSVKVLSRGLDYSDAHVWLSSVLTSYDTCLDGLNGTNRSFMEPWLGDLIASARVALALLVSVNSFHVKPRTHLDVGWPEWITRRDRSLLETEVRDVDADVVVAMDGSGNFRTVKEAVERAPEESLRRYVIHVKKGVYKENVEVGKKKKNLMLVGDGMDSTIITGSLNVVDGSTTFRSATFAVVGDGFIGQNICFQNTAGPDKHQAVALRVGSDKSVIYQCLIDGYQDTLYAHMNRVFFTKCYITGTVDFIFGNAAVVFQNCNIIVRKPMQKQFNTVTAQGRLDPNQNTGTSIQSSEIIASRELEPVKKSVSTFLGRPWREYSRTVVLESEIGDLVAPQGWTEWSGDFGLKTLYYGEYGNYGQGSDVSKRVKWPGYHVIVSAAEAKKFTVRELIQGDVWMNSTGVSFNPDL